MNIEKIAYQTGVDAPRANLQLFADLVIKNYHDENYQVRTDNTQLIYNMETKIAELEAQIQNADWDVDGLKSNVAEYSVYVNAILDQFAVAHHSYDNELSPYDNLSNLISYHVGIALDPRVSKQADEWVTKIAELEAELLKCNKCNISAKGNNEAETKLAIAIKTLENCLGGDDYYNRPLITEALTKIKGE
jgi:hypothetical protein